MNFAVEDLGVLALTSVVVSVIARRARIPYTVALVLSGAALALAGLVPNLRLSRDLVYLVFLPPLVFEAALYLDWHELRRDATVIGAMATIGVLISGAITAAGMHRFAGWPIATSLCFGALIAATDPVSVIATFKQAHVEGRLRLLVEAESLFNDATAAILFGLALEYAAGDAIAPAHVATTLLLSVGGGVAAGALVAALALLLGRVTQQHLVEVAITLGAAYGAFLVAERMHASGVLASLTAGLIVGNVGLPGAAFAAGRKRLQGFWDKAALLANTIIFLLIGVQVARERIAEVAWPAALAVGLVLLSRAASIYPLAALFSRTSRRVSKPHQHVLFWGGLRGALALALALGLPTDLPGRAAVVSVTFAVAAFSILVQGLTVRPLLARLGEVSSAE